MNQEEKTTTELIDLEGLFDKLKADSEIKEEVIEDKSKEETLKEFFPEDVIPEAIPKEETKPLEEQKDNKVYNKVLDYIEAGFLADSQIEIEVDGETKTVYLSEMKDIDADTLKSVITEYKKSQEEENKEKLFEGLDERTKRMIELKKAGGDLSELIQAEIEYVNPLNSFNLDSEKDQEILVRMSLQRQGLKPKYVEAEIAEMKENVTLDLEAQKIADVLNKQFDAHVEEQSKLQIEAINRDKEEQKEFKKSIGQVLREYNLPENISKVVLENSTKLDEVGLTNTDKLYFDSKNDPKLHAEISFFLNNKEEFKKFLGVKVKNDTTIKEVGKILKVNSKNIKTEQTPPPTDGQKKEELLKEFFNK